MKVFYVTMKFPAMSETFAGHDVLTLYQKGIDISVHSLLNKGKYAERFKKERRLEKIWITHNNFFAMLKGLIYGIRRVNLLIDLIVWIIKTNLKNKNHLLKSIFLIPRTVDIFNTIEKERPDVVHLFWGHFPSIVGYLVEKYHPDITVTIFLGAYDLEMNYNGTKPVACSAKAVFTHAKCNVPIIKRLGVNPENITVCYRGIDLERFSLESIPKKINKRIVCASRLIESKGVDDVIKGFSKINKKYPDSTLVILGDGEKKAELVKMVKSLNLSSAVDFKGHVNQDVLFQEMKKAEIFMLLSKKQSERLPNVVKEAMLAKCLCIVSETPGIEELVENNGTGYIVKSGNFNKMYCIADNIFTNKVNRKPIVEKAFLHITNNFDIKKLMDNYIGIWESDKK